MLTKETESDISKIVVDAAFKVHQTLGPGLLENTYEGCMNHELKKRGLDIQTQTTLPVIYDGVRIEQGYRLDIVVENELIVELKTVEKIIPLYAAQLLTYLKLSKLRTGLLINFNVPLIKDGIKRYSL
ncbi:MAG: GxxExxY protein [Alphaproteobacteria bacterium]|nr:GxxExxY protein [Alphaproteobacteria bacterium]